MKRLDIAWADMDSFKKVMESLETQAAATMRRGGVPQGGISISSFINTSGVSTFQGAQAFLIDE